MALLPTPSFSNHLYGASITVRDNARCRGRHCFTTRLYYHADGTVTATTAQTPINLSNASDQVILVLYGTGIRNRSSLAAANVKVGGRTLPAGSQPQYPGLDQVNVQLPQNLAGSGTVSVILTVDGITANSLSIAIQ